MTLTAKISDDWLIVSGAASETSSYSWDWVEIDHSIYDGITVTDNDSLGVQVPVSGNVSSVHNIDARGVTGAGVYIYSYDGSAQSILKGSNRSDTIYAGGTGKDRLFGYDGNDTLSGNAGVDRIFGGNGKDDINGGDGNDFLFGHRGADEISGGDGDDTITGGLGNDLIDGGAGADTVIFSGNRDEYTISIDGGAYVVSHVGGSRADGADRIVNVEMFQFDDQVSEIIGTQLQAVDTDTLLL